MIGRIRWPVLRILRWERRGWKTEERDSKGAQGREKRLRERLNRPSLTVIIPRMDGEAEKFWRGVLLSSFLETRNEWLTLRWQAECRPNWNNKGTTNEEEEEEEERMPSKRWSSPFLSLSLSNRLEKFVWKESATTLRGIRLPFHSLRIAKRAEKLSFSNSSRRVTIQAGVLDDAFSSHSSPPPTILSFLPYELNGRVPRHLVNNSRRRYQPSPNTCLPLERLEQVPFLPLFPSLFFFNLEI